ncbi:MAG: chromosome segregation protein SMC, partial [Oscillospiraceae bacterium]|nr:chromosome segregation protein SMC [Oscillospiraceae bacterium]
LRELDDLVKRAEKAQSDYGSAKQSLDTAGRALDESILASESITEKMRRCDVESDSARDVRAAAEARLSELESAAAVLKSQLEGNLGQIASLNQELQNQDGQQDGLGRQINERERRLSEIAETQTGLETHTNALVSELFDISGSAGKSSDALSGLIKHESEIQNTLNDQKAGLSALASQVQELYDRDIAVKQDISTAEHKLVETTAEHEKITAELVKIKEDTQSLKNVITGLELKSQNRTKKADSAGETVNRLSLELKTLKARHGMLSDMEKDYQGYSKAVKLIMQESSRGALKNIHGTAAELIKTPHKYSVAIETAFGAAMQHIIVSSEEDGKSAINYLKRRDGGRATFLPLSTINGSVLNEKEIEGDPGFEGLAINLVEYDNKYAGVYRNILGRVVIADDLTSAVRIAKKHGNRFRVVTLDGQVVNTGGSMTGGSSVTNAGVISRANELKQLAERIKTNTNDLSAAEAELAERVREKNAAEYELSTALGELRVAEDALIRQEGSESHSSALISAAGEAITSLKKELSSIDQKIQANNSETESSRTEISRLEAEAKAIKCQIEESVQGQELLTQARERVNIELSELRAQLASLDAERQALSKAVSEMSALRDEMSGSRQRQLETIDSLNTRNDEIRAEILEKERLSTEVSDEIAQQKQKLAELSEKKLAIEAERVSQGKAIQEKNREILDLERECARLEQKKLAADMEEKQIVDKLWDTYELSRLSAKKIGTAVENLAEAQRGISKLKREISELGNPNIGAIDEFERINTRYTYLSTQRDDVEKAKADLVGIIDEITAHMREIFIREFKIINEKFVKIFKELFGGGHASIILEDENDVLGCGIEIQVQPPGKSLKTITLLSGGEKAFVAIAIYFAILSVRPPPFVVMDEIEAALDDANIMRFAEHMRRISKNSQTIVISHRRGTMEEADVLYGVTMQELGVSSIIKIDLDEAERHLGNIVSLREDV